MNEQEYQELMALVDYLDDNKQTLELWSDIICDDVICELNWSPR